MPVGNMSNVASVTEANNGFGRIINTIGPLSSSTTALAASKVVVTGTGKLLATTTSVTSAEIEYVAGVTGPIQNQLTGKAALASANTFTQANEFQADTYLNYSVKAKVTSVTGAVNPYVTAVGDFILAVNNGTSGAIGITIPSAVTYAKRLLIIKDIAGNMTTYAVTLTPTAGNIDGAATLVMNTNYMSVTLFSDGTNWYII